MRSAKIQGYSFSPLSFANLSEVARDLNDQRLTQWIAAEHSATFFEALTKRLALELEGKSMILVVKKEGRVVGICGLSDYPGVFGTLQTSTYLHPDEWGTGLNGLCKQILWTVAHQLLKHDSIVSSVAVDNERSLRALRRAFPKAPESEVYEFWRPRDAMLFEIHRPPITPGIELTDANVRSLRRMLRRIPAWQRWMVRPAGKKTRVTFSKDAQVMHNETLFSAVSRVLSEQASTVHQISRAVAGADGASAAALVAAATETVADAQHHVAERIVEIAVADHELDEREQEMVGEAIVELRRDRGETVTDAEQREIRQLLADDKVEEAVETIGDDSED